MTENNKRNKVKKNKVKKHKEKLKSAHIPQQSSYLLFPVETYSMKNVDISFTQREDFPLFLVPVLERWIITSGVALIRDFLEGKSKQLTLTEVLGSCLPKCLIITSTYYLVILCDLPTTSKIHYKAKHQHSRTSGI